MSHIFISYSHKDKKYVERLEKKLLEKGFNVWIDHRIDYGDQWPKAIENAVDTCDAYIVVMTENSHNSVWVQREVIHAEKRKKPFFPLLLKGDAWFSLGNIQYVDVTNGALPPDDFYIRLRHSLPILPAPPEPIPHPKPVLPVETGKWKKPVSIVAGIFLFFAILLALAYFILPTLPSTPPFARASELNGLFISSTSNTKFDKTVYSKDDEIFLSLFLTEDQAVGNYESQWYYLIPLFGKDKKVLISTQRDNKPTVSNFISYGLNPPLFPGYYRVDVYKKGNLIGLKYFWVK